LQAPPASMRHQSSLLASLKSSQGNLIDMYLIPARVLKASQLIHKGTTTIIIIIISVALV
jgi:hypothetical protein